jgi:bacterioferritin-associated ferredoxin
MALPRYTGKCIGCGKCLLICPGLAITLVDYRKGSDNPIVTIAYEIINHPIKVGDSRILTDIEANSLGEFRVEAVQDFPKLHTQLVRFRVPKEIAKQIAGFQVQDSEVSKAMEQAILPQGFADEAMVCLCERVTVGQVRRLIRQGISDLNQLKAITRAGMGPCGAKTCEVMIKGILREEGIPTSAVVPNTKRPIFIEVPLSKFPDGGSK